MERRWRTLAGVLGTSALTAGLLALSPPGASAQVAPVENSTVTIVNAIQGVTVDVYADGNLIPAGDDGLAPGEAFGPLRTAAPGTYELSVYEHTTAPPPDIAPPPPAQALVTQSVTVAPEPSDFSVAVGLTATGAPALLRFTNDVSFVPAGSGRVSVRHTANAGPVDVYADDALLISGLANGEAFDLVPPAGTYSIEVFPAGAAPTGTPVIGPIDVTVTDGSFSEVYASTGLPTATDAPTLVTLTRTIPSSVKFVHGVPGAGAVDVYDITPGFPVPLVQGLPEGETAGPVGLEGTRTIVVVAAGDDPGTPTPVFTGDLDFPANADSSAAIGLNAAGTPTVFVYTNDLSFAGVGQFRYAVRNIAALASIDFCVDGAVADPGVANGAEITGEVPVGTFDVSFVETGGDCATPLVPAVTVTTEPGTLYELYAVGTVGSYGLLIFPTPTEQLFNPVTPTRIADTRDGTGGVVEERLAPGEVLRVYPGANSDVPSAGVAAVALNVTAAEPTADGYLRVYPCNDAEPDVSNVNYTAGEIAEPNAVVVGVDPVTGGVCISTFAETDVIVDVFGWFAADSGLGTVTPERIADTRNASSPYFGKLDPGEILTIDVSNDPVVQGAVLNVTAANTTSAGYLTVFPCNDSAVPYASNVNYEADEAGAPNAVLTGLDAEGQVCITTYASVDVIVDLFGTFEEGSPFVGVTPERLADTRDGTGGVAIGKVQPGTPLEVQVTDDPDSIDGATLNVTATEANANGYLTVYPCDETQPYASNVNYTTEELSSPNAVVTGVSDEGTVCISAFAPVHVVVDLTGVFEV